MALYPQLPQLSTIKEVATFQELINTPFKETTNALCWARNLSGDFKEIVAKLSLQDDITNVSMEELKTLPLSPQGELARATILSDFEQLRLAGAQPSLNLLKCYERDTTLDYISTDVYSYHVDRSPVPTSTFLCTYAGATSDILLNQDAAQMIHIPAVREQLKTLHDGAGEEFDAFLAEFFFDLHYRAKPDARPIAMQNGHLWRLAVAHPGQEVLPCIHRAPVEKDQEVRLLLIC